jgi:hypothetical protein
MRIAASWACYWAGDLVSKTVEPVLGHWFEWPYRTYNRLMNWADRLQGDDPRGPWSPVENEN